MSLNTMLAWPSSIWIDSWISSLPPTQTMLKYLLPLIPVHLVLVKVFRRHFIRQLYRKHPYSSTPKKGQKPLSEMPLSAAHEVIRLVSGKDFPYMFTLALQLALVRVYAIPTISELLIKTGQLSSASRNTVGKRYADTTVIVIEFYDNAPGSKRSAEAFSRLNYLHGHYIKQNKISNDDMLYTLSQFMCSPPQWINRYEWRQLTELELTGLGLYHRFMGEAMNISFDALDDWPPPPLPLSTDPNTASSTDKQAKRTWRTDGLAFYHSLYTWSLAYESTHMLPTRSNHLTAQKTLDLFNSTLSRFLHSFASQTAISVMDPLMRSACMFPPPPPIFRRTIDAILHTRAFLLRHLALPRRAVWGWWVPENERSAITAKPDPKTGRRWLTEFDALPHYIKPTFWNRWVAPGAWFAMAMGVPRPGDEGMEGGGWVMEEVGPGVFKGKGGREFEEGKRRLEGKVEVERGLGAIGGGCPMFVRG